MPLDPLFDQDKCPVPYVPKVEFLFIDDCEIRPAPDPVFDCPDIEIPPQVPQPPILPVDIEIPTFCIPCPAITATGSIGLECNSQAVDIAVTQTNDDGCTESPSCAFVFDFNFAIPALPCPRLTAAGTVSVTAEGTEPTVDVIVTPRQASDSCASRCDYHLDFNFTIPVPSSMSLATPSDTLRVLCPEFTVNAETGFASQPAVNLAITPDDNCQFTVDVEVLFPSETLSVGDCPQLSARASATITEGDPAADLTVTPADGCAFDFEFNLQVPCPTITAGEATIETGDEPSGDIIVTNEGSPTCNTVIDIALTVPPAVGPPGADGAAGANGADGRDGYDCVDYSCYGGYAPCQLWIWCNCHGEDRWVKPDGTTWGMGDPPYPDANGRMYGEAKITCFCECISSSSISSVSSEAPIETVDTACCPDVPVLLRATLTSTCPALNGLTVTLEHQGSAIWRARLIDVCVFLGSPTTVDLMVKCSDEGSDHVRWVARIEYTASDPLTVASPQVCDPFQLVFNITSALLGLATCCSGGGSSITTTVTVTPF